MVALALGGGAAASFGCALVVDTSGLASDGVSDGATPPRDAGSDVVDATTSSDASTSPDGSTSPDAATGPRKNSCGALLFGTPIPLSNGDFEVGCANGWGTYQATVSEDTTAPSHGSIACRVCYTTGINGFYLSSLVKMPISPGETYEVVACVRAAPGSADLMPHAEIYSSNDGHIGTPVSASAAYVPVRAAWDVTTAYPEVSIDVRADGVAGSCFLVDDVSFARVRDAGN